MPGEQDVGVTLEGDEVGRVGEVARSGGVERVGRDREVLPLGGTAPIPDEVATDEGAPA